MKFLHIGINICGIPNSIRDAQIKLGHTSKTLSFYPEPSHVSDFNYDATYSLGKISSIKRMWTLFKIGKDYDVFHFVGNSFIGNSIIEGIDILLWKLLGKKIIIHYHGSEIRNKKQPFFHKFADVVFVSTPDLLKFVPGSIWLPNPIYIQNYKQATPSNVLIITHAPSNPRLKGTAEITSTIKNIQSEIPNLQYDLISGIPYIDALDHYSKATIVIDQINMGWYCMVSLECMAIGVPVVCYISEDLLKKYLPENYPVWLTTEKTFKSDIIYLLNNPNIRDKQIKIGREYVSSIHNPINIAKMIIKEIS